MGIVGKKLNLENINIVHWNPRVMVALKFFRSLEHKSVSVDLEILDGFIIKVDTTPK